jgi:hypothetical protein
MSIAFLGPGAVGVKVARHSGIGRKILEKERPSKISIMYHCTIRTSAARISGVLKRYLATKVLMTGTTHC